MVALNWRRLYWCTYDGWTGGWHARGVKDDAERCLMRGAYYGIGWKAPMFVDGVQVG